MTHIRRFAPALVAATAGAILLVASGLVPARTHAQDLPARYWGTWEAGDVAEAFIEGVSCASAVANSAGEWIFDIESSADCKPSVGATITFERNGVALLATETWSAGASPASPALGIPLTADPDATKPTPTLLDGEKPLPPEEVTIEEVKVEKTVNLDDDKLEVDGTVVVQAISADGKVTATIPIGAVSGTTSIAITVNVTADIDVSETVPTGTTVISGQTLDITITDDQGESITEFTDEVTFESFVDPVDTDVETIAVFYFDRTTNKWIQVPAKVDEDGRVWWSVNHLTLFSLMKLSKVTHDFVSGLNSLTFTGADGTNAVDIAGNIVGPVENLLAFNPITQGFDSFTPGAPSFANTLDRIEQRDPLFVRVADGGTASYTSTDLYSEPDATRSIQLLTGLNAVGFTGADGSAIDGLLESLGNKIASASRYDAATGVWDQYAPGAPSFVNTLQTLDRLDVVFIRVDGEAVQLTLPEALP